LPTRKQVFSASAAASAALLGVGFAGYLGDGLPSRLPEGYALRQQILTQLQAERQRNIQSGRCNLNGKGLYQTPGAFLTHWDCRPKEKNGRTPRLVVVGDSHAADIANALSLNGVDHVQITGSACPLLLRRSVLSDQCAVVRTLVDAQLRPTDWVILANQFQPHEVAPDYIDTVMADWAGRSAKTLILSPLPEYPMLGNAFLMQGPARVNNLRPDTAILEGFKNSIATLEMPQDVRFVDTVGLLCGGTRSCRPADEGKLTYVDPHHLSNDAAKTLGARLVQFLQNEGWQDTAVAALN
jgi:hypothetical protein